MPRHMTMLVVIIGVLIWSLILTTQHSIKPDIDYTIYSYSPVDWSEYLIDTVKVISFDEVIEEVIKHEGDRFVHDTTINEVSRMGITLSTYRSFYGKGNNNSIRNITKEQATAIYKKLFWDANDLDSIVGLGYSRTATVLMDSEVNIGPYRANKFFQRVLDMPREHQTGVIDSMTLSCLKESVMTDEILYKSLILKRRNYYSRLVQKNAVYAKYHKGWNNRLDNISEFAEEI